MRAIDEVNAALTIDPNFLAAHALRDRIIATPVGVAPSGPRAAAASADTAPPHMPESVPAAAPPVVPTMQSMTEGYAKFEQRAKRRRVDRRLDAARQAIDAGRLKAAASALDEVIELDPNLPDLRELTARFDDLRRQAEATHRGPRIAAAGVFVVLILGASWLHESTSLISRPMIAAAPLLLATPLPLAGFEPDPVAVATAGERETTPEVLRPMVEAEPAEARAILSSAMPRPAIDTPELAPPMPPVAPATPPVVEAPRVIGAVQDASLGSSPAPVEMVAANVPRPPSPMVEISADDSMLVKQALQRYRVAYEGLDARSAQAVWPAVNQAALARAFDGLESQSLTFDACDVRVRGEIATATCQGSARYVPKIGSREPRTEPRVWNFSLHKAGNDWKIQSARAER